MLSHVMLDEILPSICNSRLGLTLTINADMESSESGSNAVKSGPGPNIEISEKAICLHAPIDLGTLVTGILKKIKKSVRMDRTHLENKG